MTKVLTDTLHKTIAFLRMAAVQMRHLTDRDEPELAPQLRRMADKCEAEADELSKHLKTGS